MINRGSALFGKELCYAKPFFFLMFKKGGKFQGAVSVTRLTCLPYNIMLLKTQPFIRVLQQANKANRSTALDTHTKNFKQGLMLIIRSRCFLKTWREPGLLSEPSLLTKSLSKEQGERCCQMNVSHPLLRSRAIRDLWFLHTEQSPFITLGSRFTK